MNTARSTSTTSTTESAKPYRGRRMSWQEFRKLMKEAANDNERPRRSAEDFLLTVRPMECAKARLQHCRALH